MTITRNNVTTTLAYNDADQLVSETYTGKGTLNNHAVASPVDSYLRKYQVTASYNGAALANAATYGYDAASRLTSVSDTAYSAGYGYLANSPLVNQIAFKQGSSVRMTTTKAFDNLNRLTSIANVGVSSGNYLASSHAYTYNTANQRTRVQLKDGATWAYGYDALGQVISAKKKFSDGTWVPGEQFEYVEDDVGNRTSAKIRWGQHWGQRGAAQLHLHAQQPQSIHQPHGAQYGGCEWRGEQQRQRDGEFAGSLPERGVLPEEHHRCEWREPGRDGHGHVRFERDQNREYFRSARHGEFHLRRGRQSYFGRALELRVGRRKPADSPDGQDLRRAADAGRLRI